MARSWHQPQRRRRRREGLASSHLLRSLRLRVVVQEGPFQHRGHNGEALACFEL